MVSLRKLMETRKKPTSLAQKAKPVSSGDQKKPESDKRKKPMMHFKAEDGVMKRAKEIEENLSDEFPKFIKPFTPSYVSLGCLRLPIDFCKDHISECDKGQKTVTLINESDVEYTMNLRMEPRRKELNGGWSVFSAENKLSVGDVLVFQLIEPLKFKVYVVREKDFVGKNGTRVSKKMRLTKCSEEERPLSHLRESARSKKKTAKALSHEGAVMERATEFIASLSAEFPNCHQIITASYHQRGCLRLPEQFCNNNMLGDEGIVTMVDESGKECKINYLKKRRELGGGWKQFSKDNKFCVGDVLVFQLVGNFRMKVFAVRADGSSGGDSTFVPGFGSSCIKQTDSGELPIVTVAEHNPKESVHQTDLSISRFEKESEELALDSEEEEEEEGRAGLPGSNLDFQEVKGIEDFTIVVNGMNIDSEVSEQDRSKYYKLCLSQNSYLHDRLLEDINTSQWAATIISKTVNIADSIKNCQFSTPRSEYESWDKILNSFELLGLNVKFLRDRLQRLMSLAESEGAEVFRRQAENRQMLLKAEENIKILESDIQALEEKKRRLELFREKKEELVDEMKERGEVAKEYEESFKEEVGAEW